MKISKLTIVALVASCGHAAAEPDFTSGNFWLPYCKARSELCMGYVTGIDDANALMRPTERRPYYCLPESVSVGQTIDVITRYVEQRPEERHKHFGWLAITALSKAFPCN